MRLDPKVWTRATLSNKDTFAPFEIAMTILYLK
jgi:hypothetical protein